MDSLDLAIKLLREEWGLHISDTIENDEGEWVDNIEHVNAPAAMLSKRVGQYTTRAVWAAPRHVLTAGTTFESEESIYLGNITANSVSIGHELLGFLI